MDAAADDAAVEAAAPLPLPTPSVRLADADRDLTSPSEGLNLAFRAADADDLRAHQQYPI